MKKEKLAKKAKEIIKNADIHEIADLSVSTIAAHLQVGQSQLSRAFSEYFYCDLGTELLHKRIEAFDYLIIQNETSTLNKTLARLNIFSDSHFITQYKKIKGYTPGHFIKLMKRFRKQTLYKTRMVLQAFKKKNKKCKNKCENAVFITSEKSEKKDSKTDPKKSRSQKRKPKVDTSLNPS